MADNPGTSGQGTHFKRISVAQNVTAVSLVIQTTIIESQ